MNGINRTKYLTILSLFFCSLTLAGCGGSSDTDTQTGTPITKPNPEAKLGAFNLISIASSATKPKTLVFSWSASANASSYTLCQVKDPRAQNNINNCTILAKNISKLTTEHTFSVITDAALLKAEFFVIAYNTTGQSGQYPSNEKLLSQNDYLAIVAYLKSLNISSLEQFGHSVALSKDGNTLAVGANNKDESIVGNPDVGDSGAVYVFTRKVDNTWSKPVYITASSLISWENFGGSVALSADGLTLAVGSTDNNSGSKDPASIVACKSGAVYIFTYTNDSWKQQAYLKASNFDPADKFGNVISLSNDGNTLAIGVPEEDSSNLDPVNNSSLSAGAVYIFNRNNNAKWSQQAYIKASTIENGDLFGYSVSLSGDGKTLAVGATGEDSNTPNNQNDNGAPNSGAVYLFKRTTNNKWPQQAYLKASNVDKYDNFGNSVALSVDGKTLAVGATGESSNDLNDQHNDNANYSGAVYVFGYTTSNNWMQQAYLKASNIDENDNFGQLVVFSDDGNTLAVEASGESSSDPKDPNDNNPENSGAVYLFTHTGNSWSKPLYIKSFNIGKYDHFGSSITLSGDGKTLAVGADGEDSDDQKNPASNLKPDSGAVYVY